jgi:syndetin
MWEGGMQRRLAILLGSQNFSSYPFERFLPVIESLNKITGVAEEFIGGKAHRLRDKIAELSNTYFDIFHRNRMEELSMMLENEIYTVSNLPKGYSFRDLKELRHFVDSFGVVLPRTYTRRPLSFFVQFETSGNPFTPENLARGRRKEVKSPQPARRGAKADLNEDTDPALLVSSVDELEGRSSQAPGPQAKVDLRAASGGPIVTSVTLTLVKFIGKYLDLMRTMENIAPEIYQGMVLAIDLYIYTTFSNFSLPTTFSHTRINPIFNAHMNEVKTNLIFEPPPPPSMAAGIGAALTLNTVNVTPPPVVIPSTILNPADPLAKPNPAVFKVKKPQLHQSLKQSTHQIIPSAIAGESLMFLFETLEQLKTVVRGLLPREKQKDMDSFVENTVSCLPHLRELIYRGLANKIISAQKLLPIVQDVKWDSESMPPENNEYVNAVAQTMAEFLPKIRQAIKNGSYPEDILFHIWGHLITHAAEVMVEGWSRAKKCTVQGRALMQLDVTMFRNKLEKLSHPNPKEQSTVNLMKTVDRVHPAEEYAKASWLNPEELLAWIQSSTAYTKLQLINLVNSGTWDKPVKVKCIDVLNRRPW